MKSGFTLLLCGAIAYICACSEDAGYHSTFIASTDDFARHDLAGKFRKFGNDAKTDKVEVGQHHYEYMYGKYLSHEPMHVKGTTVKLLEIGLGCNMIYGPGKSVNLWKAWFHSIDLHEMEYDKACVEKWGAIIEKEHNVTIHEGDQADINALERLIVKANIPKTTDPPKPTINQFDIIVDDGGHFHEQIKTSFEFLFKHALKPGGIYFIEDIAPMRPAYPGRANNDGGSINWLQGMAATILGNVGQEGITKYETDPMNMHAPQARWVTSLELHKNAAIIVKATKEDCDLGQAYCP